MSFDVFLARYEHGAASEAPREDVLQVLRSRSYEGPDKFGFYVVECEDGGSVEFSARGLESSDAFSSCAFHIGAFSADIVRLVFDVARAGRMAIVAAMEGDQVLLVDDGILGDLPPEMLEDLRPVVVRSAKELVVALADGFEGWSDYRDDIRGRPSEESKK